MSYPSVRIPMTKRIAALASVGTLVAAGAVVAVAAPSQAALTTTCVGTAGAVTVPGDLIVPADESCELTGTVVLGNTTVRAGADLILLEGAELQGAVTVRSDAFIAAEHSTVGGPLNLRAAFGGYLIESTTEDVVDSRNGSYVYSLDSVHSGEVTSRAGELYLESAMVDAGVASRNDRYADVYDSTITGDLLVAGVTGGSLFCYSEVDGNAVYRGSSGDIQIGAEAPLSDCGFNVFAGDLRINNNTGDIRLSDNVVRGNLVCNGNTNAPAGEGNRVRGEARGQCAEIAPAAVPSLRAFADVDRKAGIERRLQTRLESADAAATEAGPTDLG